MRKILKWIGFAGIGLALVFVIVLFAFYYLIETGEFRRLLVSEFEKQTRLKASIGETEVELGWVMGVSFRDFALYRPGNSAPVVSAPKILVRVALTPLLRRKMAFHEVRLYQPKFQWAEGQGDASSARELIAHLLFLGEGNAQPALDLRRVRIEQGQATFPDMLQSENGSGLGRIHDMDVTLERIVSKAGPKAPSNISEGKPGVEFSVTAGVTRQGTTSRLRANGQVYFPDDTFDLRKAWFDTHISIEGLPAGTLRDGYALPLKGIHSTLGLDLDLRGSVAAAIHAQGKIDFKELRIEASEPFRDAVIPGAGSLDLELVWTTKEIRISRLGLRSEEISLAAQGSIRNFGDEDPYLEIGLTTPFLPVQAVQKYIPWRALRLSQWEDWAKTITEGEIKLTRAGASGPLSEMKSLFKADFAGRLWFDAEVQNAGGDAVGDRYLSLRNISGRIVLENGDLYYKLVKGRYGVSRLDEIEATHKRIFLDRSSVELRATGEVDLGELKGQLGLPFVPERIGKLASEVRDLGGKGRFSIALRKQAASPYRFEGLLALENGALRTDHVSLTQIQGKINFSPRAISTDAVTARLEGSPIRFKGAHFLEQESFDITVETSGVNAGPIMKFLPDAEIVSGAGTVGGWLRYRGSIASKDDRALTGLLRLRGVHLPMKLFNHAVDQVNGEVNIGEQEIQFRRVKGRIIESGFDFNGRWSFSEQPQLTFTFSSPEIDLGRLLSGNDGKGSELYDRLRARGKVDIGKGRYEGFQFSELKTDLRVDQRQWRLDNFFARSGAGTIQGTASFTDKPETLEFSMEPNIQRVPVAEFLNLFDIGTREITGNVDLTGKLESNGADRVERKRNLSGSFNLQIKDGVAKRLRLLVRILNLMDLTRWFSLQLPDLNQKGIHFRSITADFKVEKGVYSTQNFVVDSDDLGITGAGKFDGPNESIDAVVALRPFPRVGSAVSHIPLIGPGIAGVKDSILVASFRVQGPVNEATITPAPLSTLSEFFFGALKIPQKIITVPGTGKQ